MIHGGRWLYGRRAAQYRLDVRRDAAGRRLPAGRQRRAGGHWRVAGRRAGDAAADARAAVYRRRHLVVVVDDRVDAATAAGRFPRRLRTIVVAGVSGRVVVPG